LEYQRQLHLQRLAQQELEMKTRLEQQRQLTLAREQFVQNPQLVNIFFSILVLDKIQKLSVIDIIKSRCRTKRTAKVLEVQIQNI
jgi:hypothetical protein